jgi:hypothetical protein
MSGYELALLIGFAIAVLVAAICQNRRAVGWLCLAAGVYIISEIYARVFGQTTFTVSTFRWDFQVPTGPLVSGLFDAGIVMAVYFFGRFRWELSVVWRLFQASLGVNIWYLATLARVPLVPSLTHNDYAAILEIINWLALLFVGGTAILLRTGAADAFATGPGGRVRRALAALYRERSAVPFTHRGAG